jgi:iron-sulfur cluster repair protein YtfE (RIC family)
MGDCAKHPPSAQVAGARVAATHLLCRPESGAGPYFPKFRRRKERHVIDATLLQEQMRCLFDYEQSSVFPALTRLETQSHISRCRAGMIAARVRWLLHEQATLLDAIAELQQDATQHLSPAGPCESCHALVRDLSHFQADLKRHVRDEKERVLDWAVLREKVLTEH